ncbi:Sir2 family NAD-dependent protein deacetylase [Agromyces seonyuensis]|uniref:protein acetyllysine N-acetyltransferase n=1 Tax=Agromyces seonyuensis TaxID=2662446 RepID=A0A6I4P4Y7_9MICO|nr:Sir2 family NAD-dependent protein deacetylase [Agromyces seonyuensis]MWB98434.1 NAD-dependent deacetylase [Agromyces seonyuensis]
MEGARTAVLTGAGVSTDSGIPDYRGEGAPVRNPMTYQQFVSSEDARRRYWAGSHLGWRHFGAAQPNSGHESLARLEEFGAVNGIVTQNVDGLHSRAGSRHVVELHGGMGRVVCLDCGQVFAREAVADTLESLNPDMDLEAIAERRPDGDVEVSDVSGMQVPVCTVCGGMLKPDVVFFGEFVPVGVFDTAASLVRGADALLIAGSSLVVNSGVRLLEIARRRKLPVIVINRGPTRGETRATVRIEGGTSESLQAIVAGLGA